VCHSYSIARATFSAGSRPTVQRPEHVEQLEAGKEQHAESPLAHRRLRIGIRAILLALACIAKMGAIDVAIR
jgi:hypothetical protein